MSQELSEACCQQDSKRCFMVNLQYFFKYKTCSANVTPLQLDAQPVRNRTQSVVVRLVFTQIFITTFQPQYLPNTAKFQF